MISPQSARLPIAFIAGAIFLSGLVGGVGISYAAYQTRLQQAHETHASLVTFTQTQSIMLTQTNQSSLEVPMKSSLVAAPAQSQPVVSTTIPEESAFMPLAVMPTTPVLAAKPVPPIVKPVAVQPNVQPKPAATHARLTTKSKNAEPASVQTPEPHTSQITEQPHKPTNPAPAAPVQPAIVTAAITMEQAGIAGMDTAGIRFKSGRQINIGSDFPTGEKLISVNPSEGRIVTDKRVITLVKPAAQP